MNIDEVMEKLGKLGTEQTKKTLINHGVREPIFGVRITDMKKLVKDIKKDQELVYKLYDTGNYDAMYLAGLCVDPKLVSKDLLYKWLEKAYCYAISETIVANTASQSKFAIELANEWIKSQDEIIEVCGWSTYSNFISRVDNEEINLDEVKEYLRYINHNIHSEKNRVKYGMNEFVICVGSYIKELTPLALEVANNIGKVQVSMGNTSCKVPVAKETIEKIEAIGRIGVKRKSTC